MEIRTFVIGSRRWRSSAIFHQLTTAHVREVVDNVYRSDSRRVLSTLVKLIGDVNLAEDALHDAFKAALEKWPQHGIPANPRAWLVSAGRFKAIDHLRRQARFSANLRFENEGFDSSWDESGVVDERLRLLLTCCHPAASPEGRAALILREVCGLTTDEIARAFQTSRATVAQRIVRAKAKIRAAHRPQTKVSRTSLLDFTDRLDTVLPVIHLIFKAGRETIASKSSSHPDLAVLAVRLRSWLFESLPEPGMA